MSDSERDSWGGARAGAGRKSALGRSAPQYSVSILEADREFFLELGDGNLSLGVHRAASQLQSRANGTGGHASPNTTKSAGAVARRVVPAQKPSGAGAAGGQKRALRYDDLTDAPVLSIHERIKRGLS